MSGNKSKSRNPRALYLNFIRSRQNKLRDDFTAAGELLDIVAWCQDNCSPASYAESCSTKRSKADKLQPAQIEQALPLLIPLLLLFLLLLLIILL